jgi:hypothetical protein
MVELCSAETIRYFAGGAVVLRSIKRPRTTISRGGP